MAMHSIRTYRGHRLVPVGNSKGFYCSYCGEKIKEGDYWQGVGISSAPIECVKHPDFKPIDITKTQKTYWV
jgi:hypothetical protein